jgi:predicted DNA-binding transcriptional regulator AlpA
MSSQIIQKQSNVSGKIPLLSDLQSGEFAVNTYDGKIFLKQIKEYYDDTLQETVNEEKIIEFTSSIPVENTIYVQKAGDDNNDGKTWSSSFLTIEAAIREAERRNSLTLIQIGPGVYTTKGHIDVPDNTVIQATHRTVFVKPETGYEERNVFRLGSGCFLEGIVFENWRLDDLDNPTEGFAVCFRPGAKITRVPYAHKIAVRTPPYWSTIAPPLDRLNGNPLVGRGAGVALADASVLDPDSIFPNIMTWGATPVSHNGIGYCAKNGGLINAVNAISLWAHKHFLAIDGGQIILSSCSTQFGDYTMVSQGTRNLINPYSVEDDNIVLVVDEGSANLVNLATNAVIQDLLTELQSQSFTTNWPTEYLTLTERDSELFFQSLVWVLRTANERPMLDFAKGFFDTNGNRAFTDINYNYDKCYRDTQLITDAIRYDVLFGTNYRSINAALAYYRANSSEVITTQLENTLLAIQKQKEITASYLEGNSLTRSNALFDEILNILENGESSASAYSLTDPTDYDVGFFNARRLLVSNKTFIQDEIDAWIADQIANEISPFTSGFTYDVAACRRDVGLIVDALRYDLTYGGNLETYNAAIAYFVGATSQLGAGEKQATLAAYQRLKDIIGDILQGISITPSTNNVTVQDISGTAGSLEAATFAQTRIQEISDTIDSDGTPPTVLIPELSWPDDEYNLSYYILTENTIKISKAVMDYLSTIYTDYNYDKCYRDVLLINEAVAYDVLFNSNYRSINSALSYYRQNANKVINSQKAITIQAIERQQQTLVSLLSDGDSITRANALFTEILNILNNGAENASSYFLNDPTGYNTTFLIGYGNARQQLVDNKTFIQDEIDAWIADQVANNISPFTTSFTYDEAACRRDVGLIIDALRYDLTYGGNLETYNAAVAYFLGNISQLGSGEIQPTVATYNYLKTILSDILVNVTITPTTGNTTLQTTGGLVGSQEAVTFTLSRIDDIIGSITTLSAPTRILPNTSWPASNYISSFNTILGNTNVIATDVLKYINVENKSLLGAFIFSWEYIRDELVSIVGISAGSITIINALVDSLIRTILNPNKISEPSTITAIGHTWSGIMSGVALTKIPPARNQNSIQESILELDRGVVIASGQDDQGSALFIGGMEINADTGELSGPPFDTAVNRIATRAAIARSF